MKKWIDEYVFLIEAFLTFINFPLLYIIYKQGLWTKEFMIPLFVVVFIAAISIDRYLRPFIKEKEVYCVDFPICFLQVFVIKWTNKVFLDFYQCILFG